MSCTYCTIILSIGTYPLVNATREALDDYYTKLYEKPWYSTVYPDRTETIRENISKAVEEKRRQETNKTDPKSVLGETGENDKENDIDDEEKKEEEETVEVSTEDNKAQKTTCPIHDSLRPPEVREPEPEKVTELTVRKGDPVAGIMPCWPPSCSLELDLRDHRMKEWPDYAVPKLPPALRSSLAPICTCNGKRAAVKTCGEPDKTMTGDQQLGDNNPCGTLETRQIGLPVLQPLKTTTNKTVTFKDDDDEDLTEFYRKYLEKLKKDADGIKRYAPPIFHGGKPIALPPATLAECLQPEGKKIPQKLGRCFKTEAQRR